MTSVFFLRCISGIVYVILLLTAVWLSVESALVFWFIITVMALYEMQQLLYKSGKGLHVRIAPFVFQLLCMGVSFFDLYTHHNFTYLSGCCLLLHISVIVLFHATAKALQLIQVIVLQTYAILPFIIASFFLVQNFNSNKSFIMFIMLCIWSSDSLAYVCGSLFGRHKMAPSISPGKTWEGSIGALVLTLLWVYAIRSGFKTEIWYPNRIVLAFLIVIFSVLGDLLESKLKRLAQVKDSGNIMPGHGGVLDRMDSFMAVMLMVWLYLQFSNL
jgi:phosphatidate cytidylyltransferase